MVSHVEIIVFIIRGSFFEVYRGKREKFRIEKESVFRGVDYSTKFLRKALETKGFQVSDQKFDGK